MLRPIQENPLNKSELIDKIARQVPDVPFSHTDRAINLILKSFTEALVEDQRIEVRGFGSLTTKMIDSRIGRNPKSGVAVRVTAKRRVVFKPSKEMLWEHK